MEPETTNCPSEKREETKERIIAAIRKANGLLTLVAKTTGLHYTTVKNYVHDYAEVKQAVIESKEKMLDFAESKLWEKIEAGDNTMIIFYLKTQGKARGYIERSEFTGAEGTPLVPQIVVQSENSKTMTERVTKGEGT